MGYSLTLHSSRPSVTLTIISWVCLFSHSSILAISCLMRRSHQRRIPLGRSDRYLSRALGSRQIRPSCHHCLRSPADHCWRYHPDGYKRWVGDVWRSSSGRTGIQLPGKCMHPTSCSRRVDGAREIRILWKLRGEEGDGAIISRRQITKI